MTPELTLRLAAAILSDAGRIVGRVPKGDLIDLGAEICRRDPEFRSHLKEQWLMRLAPLLSDPSPEG